MEEEEDIKKITIVPKALVKEDDDDMIYKQRNSGIFSNILQLITSALFISIFLSEIDLS